MYWGKNKNQKKTMIDTHCKSILCAVNRGNVVKLKQLLEQRSSDQFISISNKPLWKAVDRGQILIIRTLLANKLTKIKENSDKAITAFINACVNQDQQLVEILLNDGRFDPSGDGNTAIAQVAKSGNTEIMKLLIQDGRADPASNENEPIMWACKYGHKAMLNLLMEQPTVDPSACDNEAFSWANKKKHYQIEKTLLTDARVWYKIKTPRKYPSVIEAVKETYTNLAVILNILNVNRLNDVLRDIVELNLLANITPLTDNDSYELSSQEST